MVVNLRLPMRHPPEGSGIRTQATSDALAMSRPAECDTTVSIAIDPLSFAVLSLVVAMVDRGGSCIDLKSLTHVLEATIQGTYPGSRVRFRTGSEHQVRDATSTRPATAPIFSPPGRSARPRWFRGTSVAAR